MSDFKSQFDVSVVIPLYNHARYIGTGLDSVLGQSLPAREIILIDDGSKDNGVEIARQRLAGHPRATVIAQDNAGAHTTINRCIAMATSRHIAVLNSDDLFKPWKLERCADVWATQGDVDLVFGGVDLIDDDGARVTGGPTVDWLARAEDFLARCDRLDLALANENFAVTTSNFVFRKALWERLGGFAALRYCHDMDFLFGALAQGRIAYDRTVRHIDYRVHQANTIKEYVQKVRVEIAAVLGAAMQGGLLGGAQGPLEASTLAMFDKAMADKGLGALVPFLAARRAGFADRDAFYDWAIGDPAVNAILLRHAEGMIRAQDCPRLPLQEIYTSGWASDQHPVIRPAAPVQPAGTAPAVASTPAPSRAAAIRPEYTLEALLRDLPEPRAYARNDMGLAGPVVVELSSFDRGGLEKVVLDTSVVLREFGLDSIIVSCGKVGHLGEIARAQGFTVYELPAANRAAEYRAILRRHGVRLAISHFSRVGYPVFAEMGIPNITFIHNVYAFLGGQALDHFKADDRYVDTYISVSPKATDYAAGRIGIARDKIVTVPNGLVIDEHLARTRAAEPVTRAQFGIGPDDFVFLNVASYNLHKAHYLMAEAMQMVLKKTDRIRILCIGNTIVPQHIEGLRQHMRAIGVDSHMLMPGYFPDVAPFHAIADAFLLPSFIEGWSIAMNEAMFFGKPMILSDTGGSSEVIRGNDIGILLPNEYGEVPNLHCELLDDLAYNHRHFRTAPFLARAMLSMAEQADYWRQAGKAGTQRVLDEYDFTQVVKSYFPIFEAVLAKRG